MNRQPTHHLLAVVPVELLVWTRAPERLPGIATHLQTSSCEPSGTTSRFAATPAARHRDLLPERDRKERNRKRESGSEREREVEPCPKERKKERKKEGGREREEGRESTRERARESARERARKRAGERAREGEGREREREREPQDDEGKHLKSTNDALSSIAGMELFMHHHASVKEYVAGYGNSS